MKRAHTVEKIGGTSMTCFGDVMKNVIIGRRKGSELYNRIFVVSAYGGVTNRLLEDKKTGEPGIYDFTAAGSAGVPVYVYIAGGAVLVLALVIVLVYVKKRGKKDV